MNRFTNILVVNSSNTCHLFRCQCSEFCSLHIRQYLLTLAGTWYYCTIAVLSVALHLAKRPNYDRIDNDLKYRYIKMKGDASAEQIATLEEIFELNRNTEAIEQMREDVETYEEAVCKQAALAEQARLKEQAAKEQESKAKSIKNKQDNSKVNHNKSKP